jgi:hypothetical protein
MPHQTVSYAGWYIDDVYVGPAQTLVRTSTPTFIPNRSHGLDEVSGARIANAKRQNLLQASLATTNVTDTRTLNGYKVWRFAARQ